MPKLKPPDLPKKLKNVGGVTTKVEIFKGRDLTLPSVPTLKVEIPAITLTIEYDKKISLTTIVFIVLEIARILFKQILANKRNSC